MKASKSAGQLPTGVAPIFSSAVNTTGSFSVAARSAWILATMSGAMPAGPSTLAENGHAKHLPPTRIIC
jgi:hypothetical protein